MPVRHALESIARASCATSSGRPNVPTRNPVRSLATAGEHVGVCDESRCDGVDRYFADGVGAGGGEQRISAGPGTYILVPRGMSHTISAGAAGGRFLTLMVPGGLEDMFFELGQLPPNSIRDTAVRAAISARYDSVPV